MALAGELSEFPLTDIIQLLQLSKKTGGVQMRGTLGSHTVQAWMYFRDGRIIGARLGNLAPIEAAYTCFTFSDGPFQFYEGRESDTPPITVSNEIIIMEGITRQDAAGGDAPPPLDFVPRPVPNPPSTGAAISLESDEWRVLTMVNGKSSVSQIAARAGLNEGRTNQILDRLSTSGLIDWADL